MEVKCYDCKKKVPEGEAIRQGESESRISAFSYWLCYPCHEKRKKWRFWIIMIVLGIFVLIVIGVLIYARSQS